MSKRDHSQRDFLLENDLIHPHTVVIMNLPDDAFFHRRSVIPKNLIIRFIYHGTISYRLGLDLAILAFEKARHSIPLTFTIIGNGEQKKELMQYCEERGILHSLIEFGDFIPVEQLQQIIEQYDIGIVSNRRTLIGERCMLPVKMMEYLAIGLPVIVPRLQVIQHYFSDKMVSFFEPENVEDMAQRIIELANDSSLREKQVQNAQEFFVRYNLEKQRNEYIRIIQGT